MVHHGIGLQTMYTRAKSHPDISRCFGFFDYMHDKLLDDIESKFKLRPRRAGGLLMKVRRSMLLLSVLILLSERIIVATRACRSSGWFLDNSR